MEEDVFDVFRWGVWLFVWIGAAALLGSAWLGSRRLRLLLRGARAEGRVVGHGHSSGGKSAPPPIVEFTTADGAVHRVTGSASSTGRLRSEGATVTVCYDPANPGRALILSFVQAWAAVGALAVFGAGFLGLGLMALQVMDFTADPELEVRLQEARNRMENRIEENAEVPERAPLGLDLPTDVIKSFKK